MLSNEKLEVLEKKQTYLRKFLKNEGKYLDPTGMKMINKQLRKVKSMIEEAVSRDIIGITEDKDLVYLAPSALEGVEGLCVYIEGLPVVWSADDFSFEKDRVITLNPEEGKVIRFTVTKEVDA